MKKPVLSGLGLAGICGPGSVIWLRCIRKARSVIPPTVILLSLVGLVFSDTHYVDLNSTNPEPPFTSRETASTDIQAAVDEAVAGDVVLISDGTYYLRNTVTVGKGVVLRSVNGPDATVLDAKGRCRVLGVSAVSGAVEIDGLTITGGDASADDPGGGGIRCAGRLSSVIITNCVVRANRSVVHGGGISGGSDTLISDCLVADNECRDAGGGIIIGHNSRVRRCRIFNNRAGRGGGVYLGPDSLLENSVLYHNSTSQFGGGGVQGNPGNPQHRIISCTIMNNRAVTHGGGVLDGHVFNSIVFGNKAAEDADLSGDGSVVNSCAGNAPGGHGNVDRDPGVIDAKAMNFRLRRDSPCIDTGANQYTNSVVDIDHAFRAMDGNCDGRAVVDMGAYEFQMLTVEIDIRPGTDSTSVNIKVGGLLPVAILTSDEFDAVRINPSSVRFGETKPVKHVLHDVDDDGDVDLVLAFRRRSLKLSPADTRVILTGETRDKKPFMGMAAISVTSDK